MSSGFDEWCGAELSLHREKGRGGRGHSGLENWKEQNVPREDQYTLMAVSGVFMDGATQAKM